jgi:hypothetical protein
MDHRTSMVKVASVVIDDLGATQPGARRTTGTRPA